MITLEQVEKLMQETGADFYLVSWALKASNGDETQAKEYIKRNRSTAGEQTYSYTYSGASSGASSGTSSGTSSGAETGNTAQADHSGAAQQEGNGSTQREGESAQAEANESRSDRTSGGNTSHRKEPNVEDILKTIREALAKVNATNIVIRKDGKVLLNLSVTVGAIGVILAPVAALIGLGAAVITSYDIVLVLEDGRELNLMAMARDEVNNIKRGWEYYTETRHEGKSGKSYDASYETHDSSADPAGEPATSADGAASADGATSDPKDSDSSSSESSDTSD